jgi:TctA family transporter
MPHFANARFALELIGALTAGIAAIVAAVMLSIPGRAQAWAYLPLPGLGLWLIGGGLECYRQVGELGYVPVSMFASKDCFLFIVSVGLPTAAATYIFLRRHLSVDAVRVIALATLGAALLAATLLQFVHAHGTNPVDFATHIVAVTLLTLLAAAVARVEFRRR